MTLHISRLSRSYVLQIGDRLVSGGAVDTLANKNIIYFARDAIVSIGYTGLAYELCPGDRNIPTDEFIAQILLGEPVPRDRQGIGPVTMGMLQIANWLDIGQSAELLRSSIENSFSKLSDRHCRYPFEIQIAGWQLIRRRINNRQMVSPILINIAKNRKDRRLHIDRPLPRYWHLRGMIMASAIPDGFVTANQFAGFCRLFPQATTDETEEILAGAIREVAVRHPGLVGKHCVSILMSPPNPLRVRFLPDAPHLAHFTDGTNANRLFEIAYSPWIIGPLGFAAPSMFTGTNNIDVGGLTTVEILGPEGHLGLFEGQTRPRYY